MSGKIDPEIQALANEIAEDKTSTDDPPDFPGLQYLGCGYNIFGRYASPGATKGLLFDFSKEKKEKRKFIDRNLTADQLAVSFVTLPPDVSLYYSLPKRVQYKPTFVAKVEYQSTGSLAKEQQELVASVGLTANIGAFEGELEARYEQKNSRLVTRKFYSATAIARYYDLTMDNFPPPELHPEELPVAELFKADLHDKKIPPAKLFDSYGTHYLSAITVGCRAVYGHSIDTSKLESELTVEAKLKAMYEGVGGNAAAKYITTTENETDVEQVKFYSEGLDPTAGDGDGGGEHNVLPPNVRPLAMLKSGWHNPVLIDLPKNALKPIWQLCTNKNRKKELEEAFAPYAKQHGFFVSAAANMRALYLLRMEENKVPRYRFSKTLSTKFWQGGSPVQRSGGLYVFEINEENTVPLYEYYHDTPGSNDYRYETASWEPYLKYFDEKWKKTSDKPIGYVYDTLNAPEDSLPVYDYVRKGMSDGHLGHFYSSDSGDISDNAAWRAMVHPDDDLWSPNLSLENLPSNITNVLGLEGNSHWSTPKLAEK